MKFLIVVISILTFLLFLGCNESGNMAIDFVGVKEEYKQYVAYAYKGPQYSVDTTLFYHFFNKSNFDELFQSIPTSREIDTLSEAVFSQNEAIAILKYHEYNYFLQILSVERFGNVISVKYISQLLPSDLVRTARTPLIFTTRGDYSKILFYENGNFVDEIILND